MTPHLNVPHIPIGLPIAAKSPNPTIPTVPPPPPNPEKGPLGHYLLHPGAVTREILHALAHLLARVGLDALPLVALVVAGAVAIAVARQRALGRQQGEGRSISVLSPPEVDTAGAEMLWMNLVALLRPAWRRLVFGQPHVGFELVATAGRVELSFWVPASVPPGLVERAIEAAWPGARATTAPATPPLPPTWAVTGGDLRLAGPEWYPLRTDHKVDPLRPLLGALAGLGEDEAACVQVLARPVTGRRRRRLETAARSRGSGGPTSTIGRLADFASTTPRRLPAELDPSRHRDVTAILDKAARPCFAVALRYGVAVAEDDQGSRARLRGRAHAVASAFSIFTGRNGLDRHRLRHPGKALAARQLRRGCLLSVPELATIAHLPTDVSIPGLRRAGARAVAPPPEVGTEGKVLGEAEAGGRKLVAIGVADARQHLHVLGATGSGKSTLLSNHALGDIEAGRGVVVIDPKGDLVSDLLGRMPDGRRLVLIDPDESTAPPVLNVLSGDDPDLVVDNLVGIFRRIFESYWGPRTDDVLRSACLTLLRHRGAAGGTATLADVPRLLGDAGYRAERTAGFRDDAGLGGFWRWYEEMSDAQRSQVIGPVMNKLRAFLLRDFVLKLVGSPMSSFSMADVLDGGVCLVRVPKGVLGEETARLLGSFVVAQVWQAATARARRGQSARRDAAVYIDEAQNFLTLPRSYEEMLAEARGYGLSLVLAHQHLAQLPRELREALSANARNKVMFNCSPEDARVLARHFEPELGEHDLSHLGAYQVACRLLVRGEEVPAFTLRTLPAGVASRTQAARVRREAREAFGRSDRQRHEIALKARRPGRGQSVGRSVGKLVGHRPGRSDRPGPGDADTQAVARFGPDVASPDS
jgi:hypothetical protein